MKGTIYSITINDRTYIGATTKTLTHRLNKHNWRLRNQPERTEPLYKYARECGLTTLLGDIIEECENTTKEELDYLEGEYIKGIKPELNKKQNLGGKSTSPEYKKAYAKQWLLDNPNYQKQWFIENKEHWAKYRKEYREKHRVQHNMYMKTYRQRKKIKELEAKAKSPHNIPLLKDWLETLTLVKDETISTSS